VSISADVSAYVLQRIARVWGEGEGEGFIFVMD